MTGPKISLDDLSYYFDSQMKDAVDFGSYGQKTGAVLALRQKLMKLPEDEFDVAIKTIEKIVGDPRTLRREDKKSKKDEPKLGFDRARELYEQATSADTATPKVSKI